MAKRVFFPNEPSGTIDDNQRYMVGVGLDPNSVVASTDFSNRRYHFNVFTGKLDLVNVIPEITSNPSSPLSESHAVLKNGANYTFNYYTKDGNTVTGSMT